MLPQDWDALHASNDDLGGLLLGHAVQRSQTENQIAAGNADHFALGEQAR
jgi:hypothetical protein